MRSLRCIQQDDAPLAFPALRVLRPTHPAMGSPEALEAYLQQAEAEGYRLVGVFENGRREAVAVAGYRTFTMLAFGRALYVDDLSTLPDARGRGTRGRCWPGWRRKRGGGGAPACTSTLAWGRAALPPTGCTTRPG